MVRYTVVVAEINTRFLAIEITSTVAPFPGTNAACTTLACELVSVVAEVVEILVDVEVIEVAAFVATSPPAASTSQSPAVSDMFVIFATTVLVRLTELPEAITLSMYSPTLPAAALSLVLVPTKLAVVIVGDVPNTLTPEPVSSVKAVARFAEEKLPREVAFPVEVIAPVRLALVVTVAAFPVIFV